MKKASEVMKVFSILFEMMITGSIHTYAKAHQNVLLKLVHFIKIILEVIFLRS